MHADVSDFEFARLYLHSNISPLFHFASVFFKFLKILLYKASFFPL